jgi:hypothetical protein
VASAKCTIHGEELQEQEQEERQEGRKEAAARTGGGGGGVGGRGGGALLFYFILAVSIRSLFSPRHSLPHPARHVNTYILYDIVGGVASTSGDHAPVFPGCVTHALWFPRPRGAAVSSLRKLWVLCALRVEAVIAEGAAVSATCNWLGDRAALLGKWVANRILWLAAEE